MKGREMNHYKSWSYLNKKLQSLLCDELRGRITYFLTSYHKVHNSYGRACVRLDGREIVSFDWINMYRQESDFYAEWKKSGKSLEEFGEAPPDLLNKWDENCTYCEADFLSAATAFLNMPINQALQSDNSIIKMLAIMDRRTGKRTLQTLTPPKSPTWLPQFYELRVNR